LRTRHTPPIGSRVASAVVDSDADGDGDGDPAASLAVGPVAIAVGLAVRLGMPMQPLTTRMLRAEPIHRDRIAASYP